MLYKLATLPEDLGQPETLLADTGYFSAANVETCQTAGIAPLIALGREAHHPSLSERFAEAPSAPDDPTAVEAMAHRLKTLEGRKLYAQRKHIPNRSSASSSPCWDSASSCSAVSIMFAASGTS